MNASITTTPITAAGVAAALRGARFDEATEARMQLGVAAVFERLAWAYEREVVISPRDRIDFLIGGVGIECKIGGSANDLLRQLQRYALHDRIGSLVVLSSRWMLVRRLPAALEGKPVHVVATMGGIR